MTLKTLIIDEHDLVRAGIRLMLRDINPGMEIIEAAYATEAILQIEREGALDAVLMDIAMPDQDGLTLLRQIKNRLDCPVVIISGEDNPLALKNAMQLGVVAHIPKSSQASYIRRQLKHLVDQCVEYRRQHPRPVVKSVVHPAARQQMAGIPRVELTEDMADTISNLTKRQKEVLELLAAGKTNKQICATLGLSDGTVKNHVTAILSTLGVNRRTRVALLAREYARKQA